MMTLEQFCATGRDVNDIGRDPAVEDEIVDGRPGRIYNEGLYIERFAGGWLLTIGNCSEANERLDVLELELYEWARDEGWLDVGP